MDTWDSQHMLNLMFINVYERHVIRGQVSSEKPMEKLVLS